MWSGQGTDERLARFCERAESGRRSDVYLGRFWRLYGGCFEIPRSDAQSRQQGRALRDFAAWCLLAVACGFSRAEARTVTRKSSLRREK